MNRYLLRFGTLERIGAIVLVVVFFGLIIRNNGLYPIVFADEFTYSRFSRLISFDKSLLPNYLYFFVYRLTNVCGDGYLGCARIINILFFFSSLPFIYLVARTCVSHGVSFLIVLLVLLGPVNSYVSYFMPESMYFFSFWFFSWSVLKLNAESSTRNWVVAGGVVGLSALVKPHTLFLLPALLVYILIIKEVWVIKKMSRAAACAAALIFGALLVKLAIGYSLAGNAGLTLFGEFYSPYGLAISKDFGYYANLVSLAVNNLKGHLLALCLLYAVPVCLMLKFWLEYFGEPGKVLTNNKKVIMYSTLVIASLVAVTGLFTASIATTEPLNHLHIRYYSFALPLLLIVASMNVGGEENSYGFRSRLFIGIPVGVLLVYAILTKLIPFQVHSSTAPEIYSVLASTPLFYSIGGASFLSLMLWIYSERVGSKAYLYIVVPLVVVVSGFYMNVSLRDRIVPDVFDRAALFANAYLDRAHRSKVVIVGATNQVGGLFRTLFHLDLENTAYGIQTVEGSKKYDLATIPDGKDWVLVVGEHEVIGRVILDIPGDGFSLIHVR